ncbi:hypothetical protein [Paenibacillus campi]|uniref:hypothetical protein n=1 Tax=Paenibacillus campi TaxID=3106031 RepID=UPI002AFEDC9E|nr:hypothetical protein [Paenibacillus sp. SGZ-1009]
MQNILLTCTAIGMLFICAACSNTGTAAQSALSASSPTETVINESANKDGESTTAQTETTSARSTAIPEMSTQAETSSTATADSLSAEQKQSSAAHQQQVAFDHYVNARYGYSIAYPATWTAGEESDNGDGKPLYVGNPDIEISVYAANYMKDVSDPYHDDDQHVQRQQVVLDNGKKGTLVIGKEGKQILYDMVYVSKDDVEYHFYAKVRQPFWAQHAKLLLKVAKSLDVPAE